MLGAVNRLPQQQKDQQQQLKGYTPAVSRGMTADLDHMRTDFEPKLTKGQGLCEGPAQREGHLQSSQMLFLAQRGVLGHVNLDFANSDKPVFILPKLCCGLHLEDVFLQMLADMSSQLLQRSGSVLCDAS